MHLCGYKRKDHKCTDYGRGDSASSFGADEINKNNFKKGFSGKSEESFLFMIKVYFACVY